MPVRAVFLVASALEGANHGKVFTVCVTVHFLPPLPVNAVRLSQQIIHIALPPLFRENADVANRAFWGVARKINGWTNRLRRPYV